MTISKISPDTLDDCVKIYLKAYNRPPWNYQWTADMAKKYLLEYVGNPQFTGFALYDQDNIVAAVFGHEKTWWTAQQLIIDEFFVAPENQRMGHGNKLMNHVNEHAQKNGIDLVILMTNKYMPSYKFYNKIGFTTTEQFVFMFNQITEK
jgi:aminoglycoside 6'-N-acetyltransferase I